jgi:hypothetical protein
MAPRAQPRPSYQIASIAPSKYRSAVVVCCSFASCASIFVDRVAGALHLAGMAEGLPPPPKLIVRSRAEVLRKFCEKSIGMGLHPSGQGNNRLALAIAATATAMKKKLLRPSPTIDGRSATAFS